MVQPVDPGERASFTRKLKLSLAAVVGLSGGLIALQGDAPLPVVAATVAGGVAIGTALVWFVFP
jgi:hypothetical protein